MSLFTVVDENYAVTVFTNLTALATWAGNKTRTLYLDEKLETTATVASLRNEFKQSRYVRLYDYCDADWVFKVQKH